MESAAVKKHETAIEAIYNAEDEDRMELERMEERIREENEQEFDYWNYEITVCRFDRITKTHTTHGTRPHPGGHYRLKDDEICHSRGEYVDVLTNPGSWTVRKHI